MEETQSRGMEAVMTGANPSEPATDTSAATSQLVAEVARLELENSRLLRRLEEAEASLVMQQRASRILETIMEDA